MIRPTDARVRPRVWLLLLALSTWSLACVTPRTTRQDVSDDVRARTGATLRAQPSSTAFSLPDGVRLDDGLSEREAIATALWNNGAFQSDLAQLDVARADLAEAALLPNPILSLVFPLGPRQLAAAIAMPVDFLWQRPRRVELAQRELARVGQTLVQGAIDLARDARVAYLDAQLATERVRLTREALALLAQSRTITLARVELGDAPPVELALLDADAAAIETRAAQAAGERDSALARLARAMGAPRRARWALAPFAPAPERAQSLDSLVERALSSRPDVRAAEIAIEAASERVGWEKSRAWNLIALLDSGFTNNTFGASPGLRAELPLFSRNQGGISRAEAELSRASWRYVAVRQQVTAEVALALATFEQAAAQRRIIEQRELPAVERLAARARQDQQLGESAMIVVIDATRRTVDVQARLLESRGLAARAWIELERSVGGMSHGSR